MDFSKWKAPSANTFCYRANNVDERQASSFMASTHLTDMSASSKLWWPIECSISKVMHVFVMACVHRLGDICTSQNRAPSAKECALLANDVGQRKASSQRTCNPQSCCVHIYKEISPSINSRHLYPRKILVMEYCIDRIFGTNLYRISHGLCRSLIVRRSSPYHITLGLHTTINQCQTRVVRIHRSIHITKKTLVLDLLHQPCLIHIAKLESANIRQHHHHKC